MAMVLRSSIWIARSCGGRPGRSSARRSRRRGSPTARSPASSSSTGCTTCSARTGRRMEVTRRAVRFASGWVRAQVQEAGELAAEALAGSLQPFARPLFEEHRAAGRPLVLATTTPYDLVKPLADALGLRRRRRHPLRRARRRLRRHPRRRVRVGRGQAPGHRRVGDGERRLPRRELGLLRQLLRRARCSSAVRHPVVGEPRPPPDACSPCVRRWPVVHLDVPSGVPKLPSSASSRSRRSSSWPVPSSSRTPGSTSRGVEHIPEDGPAIVVGNHRSYFDPMAMAVALAKRGRPVRFLGKKEVFDAPIVGQVAKAMGGIRVERGTGSDEPLAAAAAGPRGRRAGGDDAAGHDPSRSGLLRPGAQGPLGRGPAGRHDRRAGHPGRAVGHGEGVAAQRAPARTSWRSRHPPTITIRVGGPVEGLTGDVARRRHRRRS